MTGSRRPDMDDPWPCCRPSGFVQIKSIQDYSTGSWVPVDIEIHADDLDWLINAWREIYLLDWKIGEAARNTPHLYMPKVPNEGIAA